MHFVFHTLGCRTNQAESAGMAELLRSRGHEVTKSESGQGSGEFPDYGCDAVIINTCTVTSTADKKSRNAIRRLRSLYPNALLAVCGCMPQTESLDGIDGIDLLGGTTDRPGFINTLEDMLLTKKDEHVSLVQQNNTEREFCALPDARPIGRSRAYIKIQDGCDNRCAYCKIPLARGRSRSRPVESILQAAKEAVADGAIEIVLTGIEISSFKPSLADLTAAVCSAASPVYVRLSSLDPQTVSNEFIDTLRYIKNFSPAFHLALQSCCDETLAAMGRRNTVSDVYTAFTLLRGAWPNSTITADIIVGFPGESDGDFEETYNNLLQLSPNSLHIFPYSRRTGTVAANMPKQLTRAEKTARVKRLSEAFPKQALCP